MRESSHVLQLISRSYSNPEAVGVIPTSARMIPAVLDHSCFLGTSIAAFPKPQLWQPRLCVRTGVVPPIVARQETRTERVQKRHKSIRNKVEGRPERPRLAVYRSNNHIYAQVIDDSAKCTLVAASTLSKDIRQTLNGGGGGNQDAAQLVGKRIAELCLEKNIEKVCFDRGGNIYHGRVKALADAAREGGLLF